MRYKESQQQQDSTATVHPGMIMGTAVYTLGLGVAFIVFGLRKHQRWLAFWGATMVLAGGAYLFAGW